MQGAILARREKAPLLTALAVSVAMVGAAACGAAEDGSPSTDELHGPPEVGAVEQAYGLNTLIVMTVNTRLPIDRGERSWETRFPHIAGMLQAYNVGMGPHVIGIQETNVGRRDMISRVFPEPGNPNFGTTAYWSFAIDRGDGSEDALLLHRDRFDILDTAVRRVTNGERDGSCGTWDNEDPNRRVAIRVRARDLVSGRINYFYSTHFPSQNSCERIGMARIIADWVNQRPDKTARVIFMGDLNDGVNADGTFNTSYTTLLNGTGFRDTFEKDHVYNSSTQFLTTAGKDWVKSARAGKKIDHIITNDMNSVIVTLIDRHMFSSDHRRVWCDVVTNGRCPDGVPVQNYQMYSDHWAVMATFFP